MIDAETYKLDKSNYHKSKHVKRRIVVGNSFSRDMSHFQGWIRRNNGRFARTAMFTIDRDGAIYQHFSPLYYSDFIGEEKIDQSLISVVLVNEGWLIKDLIDEKQYIAHNGNIYTREEPIFIKRWRNFKFWAPYNKEQEASLLKLATFLCNKYNITPEAIEHNLNTLGSDLFEGVMYKSNFAEKFTDISPAWGCMAFKEKFEKTLNDGQKNEEATNLLIQ